MTNQNPFPQKPRASITKDEVVSYLLAQQRRGYEVFQLPNGGFELKLTEAHCIRFMGIVQGKSQVQGYAMNNIVQYFDCISLGDVTRAVDSLAQGLIGHAWAQSPSSGRVTENEPATNLATISGLIGASSVEAIFDPYLDNRSLAAVIDILSFGDGSVADGIRVLSTPRTTGGNVPRLTKSGFDAWVQQLGLAGEIRIMNPSEHRRFLLLSSGQSLLLGQSLNSLHKNEAVRLEPDAQDRAFFEQVWSQSQPLT